MGPLMLSKPEEGVIKGKKEPYIGRGGKSSTRIQDHDIRFGGNIPKVRRRESTKAKKVDSLLSQLGLQRI